MKQIVISFDFWNTLVENISYKEERIKIIYKYIISHGDEYSYDEIEKAYKAIRIRIKQNKEKEANKYTSLHERIQVICEQLNILLKNEEVEELINLLQEPAIKNMPPLKVDVYALIRKIEKYAYLVCTSDTGMTCSNTIKKILKMQGLEDCFQLHIFSEDVGYNKPDIKMFQALINNIYHISNDHVYHVGDLYSTDIVGAKEARINSIYINSENKYIEEMDNGLIHYKINSIADVYQIVKGK